jgi:hypothetical protein
MRRRRWREVFAPSAIVTSLAAHTAVIVRLDRTIQYSKTLVIEP